MTATCWHYQSVSTARQRAYLDGYLFDDYPDVMIPLSCLTVHAQEYIIHAGEAVKGADYRCPECDGPLIVKQGKIRQWHFAHDRDEDRECQGPEMPEKPEPPRPKPADILPPPRPKPEPKPMAVWAKPEPKPDPNWEEKKANSDWLIERMLELAAQPRKKLVRKSK